MKVHSTAPQAAWQNIPAARPRFQAHPQPANETTQQTSKTHRRQALTAGAAALAGALLARVDTLWKLAGGNPQTMETIKNTPTDLFPPISPYKTHTLAVSNPNNPAYVHRLKVWEFGNPKGHPVMFLHGGPAAGCSMEAARFFDPRFYRIVLFDQRGAGESTPFGELRENTTSDLIGDVEKIRDHLGIQNKMLVFGGSWGSLLALAYAQTHPQHVSGLIVRGISLGRPEDTAWSTIPGGVDRLFPAEMEAGLAPLPKEIRHDVHAVLRYYHDVFTNPKLDKAFRHKILQAWQECSFPARLRSAEEAPPSATVEVEPEDTDADKERQMQRATIVCHYYMNDCFLKPNQLIYEAAKLKGIPFIRIVQGRYDMLTPYHRAYELSKAVPQAKLITVENAGHSAWEPGTTRELVNATEDFKAVTTRR